MSKISVLGIAAMVLGGYLLLVPGFWTGLAPDAEVDLPDAWRYNQDMPIEVTISAWHSNYVVSAIRFNPDFHASALDHAVEPIHPQVLVSERAPTRWSSLTLNRLTYQRETVHPLEVGFVSLAADGRTAPGILRGEVEVAITYVDAAGGHRVLMGEITPRRTTRRIPFEIELY